MHQHTVAILSKGRGMTSRGMRIEGGWMGCRIVNSHASASAGEGARKGKWGTKGRTRARVAVGDVREGRQEGRGKERTLELSLLFIRPKRGCDTRVATNHSHGPLRSS